MLMSTKDRVVEHLREQGESTATNLAQLIGVSRQAVSKHLRDLIVAGRVVKEGATKGTIFRLAKAHEKCRSVKKFEKVLPLFGLEEDVVFQEVSAFLGLRQRLNTEAFDLTRHGFTEILNNAIEHSKSAECRLRCAVDSHDLSFEIRDFGIGIFASIHEKFELPDEDAAVRELLKGKATTMREHHSGEGIFFTSKAADRFTVRSHRIAVTFDTKGDDVRIEQGRFLKGTEAQFVVSVRSKRKLEEVFQEYAPEEFDYKFERTRVSVRLHHSECVSRSSAKRLVARLENFKEVILDFKEVASLGQAFADEVFRVFLRAHPGLMIKLEDLEPSLRPMVEHVLSANLAKRVGFDWE